MCISQSEAKLAYPGNKTIPLYFEEALVYSELLQLEVCHSWRFTYKNLVNCFPSSKHRNIFKKNKATFIPLWLYGLQERYSIEGA